MDFVRTGPYGALQDIDFQVTQTLHRHQLPTDTVDAARHRDRARQELLRLEGQRQDVVRAGIEGLQAPR